MSYAPLSLLHYRQAPHLFLTLQLPSLFFGLCVSRIFRLVESKTVAFSMDYISADVSILISEHLPGQDGA
uniref:Uncharacterized protein n=1 Tax=Leishmania guyanensis TaxID=5670 RepID=A0A1E1J9B0_LEIGU|nr:Hypothetical protein BN36_NA76660 [Leishmania guyanensis]CCM20202.1 Hypothetical protein BN36_NA77000 [Leishmania guyanensis]